jgi:Sodium:solute symporter family.
VLFFFLQGGLKAVIWIDFLQTVVIIISCIVIIIVGVVKAGGVGNVWHKSSEGGRILIFE